MNENLIFHQLFEKETSTYTYLLADNVTKDAIIIDPVIDMVDRDTKLISELGLKLKFVFDTHVHADHITASGELRKKTGAKVALSSAYDMSCADLHLEDKQELDFGGFKIKAISTPGHTAGCMSYIINNMVFTGDALLVRGCGRTDFQEGSSEKLFSSVREKLFNLPEDTVIYPAHDYKGFTKSTIKLEKFYNPRLRLEIDKDEFKKIMANLNLSEPKKINEAVPANLQCGLALKVNQFNVNPGEGIPTVTGNDLHTRLGEVKIIDVRGSDEYNNELGHIQNSHLVTLGPDLEEVLHHEDKKEEIVFVCRSGKRSAVATKMAIELGFQKVYNLHGGMIEWRELDLPFERDRGGS
jgi:sulfur dioxygenase